MLTLGRAVMQAQGGSSIGRRTAGISRSLRLIGVVCVCLFCLFSQGYIESARGFEGFFSLPRLIVFFVISPIWVPFVAYNRMSSLFIPPSQLARRMRKAFFDVDSWSGSYIGICHVFLLLVLWFPAPSLNALLGGFPHIALDGQPPIPTPVHECQGHCHRNHGCAQ